jgi:hypothetical protein
MNHLDKLQSSKRQMMRQAAIVPARIEIDELPHAILSQDDEALHRIIHDFQNKLLNVQLTHELLIRFGEVERFTPPEPLPDRTRPAIERIQAILQHTRWWAIFYTEQMQALANEN